MKKSSNELEILRTTCTLDCPDACSLEVETTNGRVTRIDGASDDSFTNGFICRKVHHFADHVYCDDRVMTPLARVGTKGEGKFEPISWDDALDRIATRLGQDRDSHGGESILPVCYGGSNGKLTQDCVDMRLFYRLGASHLDRNVCAAPSTAAYRALYGRMPGVALSDFVHSKLIIVWGNNPHASGIHLVPYIREAQKKGAKLVVIDPRATKLASAADLHLPVFPGTDLPLALAMIHWLFDKGYADREFLQSHTTGSERLAERAREWTLHRASETARVPLSSLETLVRWYVETDPAVIRCGWGAERNRNGGSAIAAILAIPAVANKFGRRGGGFTMSNSGAWTLGSAATIQAAPPATRHVNMNVLGDALQKLDDPPIKSLFVYNCNPLVTLPEQNKVLRGLEREDLFTIVFDQVMTDTARFADIILPATTFLEHHDLRNGYGYPRMGDVKPVIGRVGESRPNYEVFADLIKRIGLSEVDDEIDPLSLKAALLGRTAFDELQSSGRLEPASGLSPLPMVDIQPATPSKKIELFPTQLEQESSIGLYRYLVDTAGSQFPWALISPSNSQTVNSSLGQLVKQPACIVMHPNDASDHGLEPGRLVEVSNSSGSVVVVLKTDDRVRRGVTELAKGIWRRHTKNGKTGNALVPDSLSDIGRGACFNDTRVQVTTWPATNYISTRPD